MLGVIPHVDDALVAAEDSLDLESHLDSGGAAGRPGHRGRARIPRIANFDDFEPLAAEPGVRVRLVRRPADLDGADLVILPGSKSTIADLGWLRGRGLPRHRAGRRRGRQILGVCGGYQMLGRTLLDPDHVESSP